MLLKKFFNVGFEAIEVHDRRPFGLEHLARYPLFTPEFLDMLRRTLPSDRLGELVHSLAVTARRPALRTAPRDCAECHHINVADASFCSRCGTRLDGPATVVPLDVAMLLDLGEGGCDVGATLELKNRVGALARGQILENTLPEPTAILDGGDRSCGELILALKRAMEGLPAGEVLKLTCADPGAREDVPAWCRLTGHRLVRGDGKTFYIQRKEA